VTYNSNGYACKIDINSDDDSLADTTQQVYVIGYLANYFPQYIFDPVYTTFEITISEPAATCTATTVSPTTDYVFVQTAVFNPT
jgi:hypothetical protein